MHSPTTTATTQQNGGRVATTPAPSDLLGRLTSAVDEIVGLDLHDFDEGQLRLVTTGVSAIVGRLEGLRARAVRTAETVGIVERSGATSAASWLADTTGGTPAVAARTARLGRALDRLPALAEAVATGTVGPEHASSIARAADRGVIDDRRLDTMVGDAGALSAGAFARTLRAVEARHDQRRLRRDERHAHRRRSANWWVEDDGSVSGSFRLDPIAGATFTAAADSLTHPDTADVPDDLRRTPTQRRADALAQLARLAVERGETPTVRAVKPHVTVSVPVSMLAPTDECAEADGAVGTLPDGTIISAATARRLLCDATVRRLVLDPAGQPLDVGRATRAWRPAQRAALAATDGACRGPACDRPFAWTDIHHIRWWRQDGRTSIDNGIPLCGRCHDLVHHDGWSVELDGPSRRATWQAPDGRTITTLPAGPAAAREHRR